MTIPVFQTLSAKLQLFTQALFKDFSKVSTYVKTAVTGVIAGGAATAYQLMANPDHAELLFTPDGLTKLKHTFFYGAAVSIIGLFRSSPLTSTTGTPVTTPATPPATS